MAARAFWNGYLKLSLVTCAVGMLPVVSESEKVRFHTINRKTGNRIQSRYVDSVSGKPVDDDDQVKGYPRDGDDYVMLEDEELEAVALESTRTIDIGMFVPKESIRQIWLDMPHFLVPNDAVGAEAFAVIREAMRDSAMVGISRVVLYRRERAVMLEPRDRGIVLWTLRYGDEVRDESGYFEGIEEPKLDPKLRKMVEKLIAERTKPWSPEMANDPVETHLKQIIETKRKGPTKRKPKAKEVPAEPEGDNVINLMDALKRSLKHK